VSVHDPPRLHSEPPKLLNIELNGDPDLAFHSSADPDPASQNNTDNTRAKYICKNPDLEGECTVPVNGGR
jgi:hypothetical protein